MKNSTIANIDFLIYVESFIELFTMAKVIVTGGAGYIGSHTVIDLLDQGHEVVCIDNFFNCHPQVWTQLEELAGKKIKLYNIDLTDRDATLSAFETEKDAQAVIHFAARIYVGESVDLPTTYFRENITSMLNVLDAMTACGQSAFIFSSSCSVYGNAKDLPVTEKTPFGEAESPYARTKQMGEHIVTDYVRANPNVQGIILRYFNPAGAHKSGKIGEAPKVEQTHLVPIIMEVATGHRSSLKVFGGDYPTRDGSCVRDFIHVSDLGNAHTKAVEFALDFSKNKTNPEIFNLGNGEGVTVLEAIAAFKKATGQPLAFDVVAPRDGDVAAVYSTTKKSTKLLGWKPTHSLEDIMRTAWEWEKKRPEVLAKNL